MNIVERTAFVKPKRPSKNEITDLANDIVLFINATGAVDFDILCWRWADELLDGNRAITVPGRPDAVLWATATPRMASAMRLVLSSVKLKPSPPQEYHDCFGDIPGDKSPIPKLPTGIWPRRYKTPHWFPIVMHAKVWPPRQHGASHSTQSNNGKQ